MSARAVAYIEALEALLGESERLVALAIAALADEADDRAYCTTRDLVARSGLKVRCVQYQLRSLRLPTDTRPAVIAMQTRRNKVQRAFTIFSFPGLVPSMANTRRGRGNVLALASAAKERARVTKLRSQMLKEQIDGQRHRAQRAGG